MSKTDLYKEQITKAINAFSQKRFDEAEGICLKILSENNNSDANHILGCIRMSEGKYDESISYINKSLSVNPEDIGTLISLGCALSSKKDYKESILVFKKLISFFSVTFIFVISPGNNFTFFKFLIKEKSSSK